MQRYVDVKIENSDSKTGFQSMKGKFVGIVPAHRNSTLAYRAVSRRVHASKSIVSGGNMVSYKANALCATKYRI